MPTCTLLDHQDGHDSHHVYFKQAATNKTGPPTYSTKHILGVVNSPPSSPALSKRHRVPESGAHSQDPKNHVYHALVRYLVLSQGAPVLQLPAAEEESLLGFGKPVLLANHDLELLHGGMRKQSLHLQNLASYSLEFACHWLARPGRGGDAFSTTCVTKRSDTYLKVDDVGLWPVKSCVVTLPKSSPMKKKYRPAVS